jgi:hypothetical protein
VLTGPLLEIGDLGVDAGRVVAQRELSAELLRPRGHEPPHVVDRRVVGRVVDRHAAAGERLGLRADMRRKDWSSASRSSVGKLR